MPTDPFVSPGLEDRPRQHQNLAPGVAYPPAGHWVPGRPGDVGGAASVRRFGTPGPNAGYAYTLAERAESRYKLAPHEHLDDAVAVVAEIAIKRAASLGRAPVGRDIDVAMALLGYDGSADDETAAARALTVRGAAHDYAVRRSVVDSVPEDLVRLPLAELGDRAGSWRREALLGRVEPATLTGG